MSDPLVGKPPWVRPRADLPFGWLLAHFFGLPFVWSLMIAGVVWWTFDVGLFSAAQRRIDMLFGFWTNFDLATWDGWLLAVYLFLLLGQTLGAILVLPRVATRNALETLRRAGVSALAVTSTNAAIWLVALVIEPIVFGTQLVWLGVFGVLYLTARLATETWQEQVAGVLPPRTGMLVCVHCQYDLRGLPEGHLCPECGGKRAAGAPAPLPSDAHRLTWRLWYPRLYYARYFEPNGVNPREMRWGVRLALLVSLVPALFLIGLLFDAMEPMFWTGVVLGVPLILLIEFAQALVVLGVLIFGPDSEDGLRADSLRVTAPYELLPFGWGVLLFGFACAVAVGLDVALGAGLPVLAGVGTGVLTLLVWRWCRVLDALAERRAQAAGATIDRPV